MGKPWVAAVQGAAAGGGCNLALSCDFVIAAENAQFVEAFVNIGLTPDTGGLWVLSKLVGITRAKEIAMTGRRVSAAEALSYGMCIDVAPVEELEERALAFTQLLASKPPASIRYIKAMANQIPEMSFASYLELEAAHLTLSGKTEDHQEGVNAFLEKRPAQFKGK
jgi:enoyl-CoA hydratase/carnithine racemase